MALSFPQPALKGALLRLLKVLDGDQQPLEAVGSQRPREYEIAGDDTFQGRYFDLEIPDFGAVRDPERATILWDMRNNCSEVATAINMLCDDALSHPEGDTPITVDDHIDAGGKFSVDPETKTHVEEFLYNKAPLSELRPWMDEFLSTGDCFPEIIYQADLGGIHSFLQLPVWEIFRVEDNAGRLYEFNQRRFQTDAGLRLHPAKVIHFRYQRYKLYGRALFEELKSDWKGLGDAETDWSRACRELGLNPLVHKMPECASDIKRTNPDGSVTNETYRQQYIRMHKAKMLQGPIAHYYLDSGATIESASSQQSNLSYLYDRVEQKQRKFFQRARIPPWLVGLKTEGAKEVSGLPGESYARHINSIRQTLTEGLSYAISIDLALKGITGNRARFRLRYPPIITNPYGKQADISPGKSAEVSQGTVDSDTSNNSFSGGGVGAISPDRLRAVIEGGAD